MQRAIAAAGAATATWQAELPDCVPAAAPPPEVRPPRRERRLATATGRKLDRAHHAELDRARSLQRWRERWEAGGGDPVERPPAFPARVWGIGRAIVHSPAASRAGMRWLAHSQGGAVVARVDDAAFAGGRWDHSDLCARRFIALAVCQYMLASHQLWGRGPRGTLRLAPCVRGFPRTLWCALLAAPHSRTPIAVETFSQTHGEWSGYLPRGQAAGVWDAVQVPAAVAEPWEIGASGHAINRYWLASSSLNKPALELDRDAALEHERGFEAVERGPVRLPRGRERRRRDAELRAAISGAG